MSFQTSRETLQVVFQEFGDVYDCYIPTDPESGRPRGFAFVTMDKAGGEDAIQELDGLELDGRFIRVNEAQGSRKSKPQRTNDGDDDWYNDSGDNQPNSGFY
jgi:RNA recognition motif-containing protein